MRGARSGRVAILAAAVLSAASALADDRAAVASWGYLIDRLTTDGVPRERVVAVFSDPRMDAFDGLQFGLVPRESASHYRGFTKSASVATARACRDAHADAFAAAERISGVSASVVAGIIHIESGCGRNTGSYRILPQLARLAMANEPLNLRLNVARHLQLNHRPSAEIEAMARRRAAYLEDTFYPEVRGVFDIADREQLDPLGIRGSRSGAFGIPQFLPRSYLRHGVDGNLDGRVSLYDPDDAIPSCARFLAAHGWQPGMTVAEKRRVLWSYNRSAPYVDTVLALAGRL